MTLVRCQVSKNMTSTRLSRKMDSWRDWRQVVWEKEVTKRIWEKDITPTTWAFHGLHTGRSGLRIMDLCFPVQFTWGCNTERLSRWHACLCLRFVQVKCYCNYSHVSRTWFYTSPLAWTPSTFKAAVISWTCLLTLATVRMIQCQYVFTFLQIPPSHLAFCFASCHR